MNNRVFFIDDEKNVLRSVTRLFKNTCFEIYTFTDPEEAIKKIDEIQPCVIVSDYRMAAMTGIEFFERIRIVYPQIIKIILSAYTDIAVAETALNRSDVDLFISKPWDEEELISEVENAVKIFHKKGNDSFGYGIF